MFKNGGYLQKMISLMLALALLCGMLPQTVFRASAEGTEHVHSYEYVVTPPTCTEQGYTTYTCALCGDNYVDSYVDAAGHSYENGICTGCGSTTSPYLQQLPEYITGCSNLYSILTPTKGYYTATKYDTSNGAVLSVVIPVEPGDRIAASSFGPVTENMGSVNGIRVTYLLDGTIMESLSASSVYTIYTQDGYLTVPAGVNMVSVPWWTPSDSNWLTLSQISKNFAAHSPKTVSAQAPTCTENGYTAGEICEICDASLGSREEIPATGHDYNGNICTICGTVNVLAILDGKYVSVLGDSISTFNGYSNDATVNSTIGGNGPRYDAGTADTKPGSYCLLESVDDTWWMHFANRSGMKLLVNNSWAGSQVFGGQTSDGRVIPAAYLERCMNLHDNTIENNPNNAPINPDVIFVYLGINDYNFNRNNVGDAAVDYTALINSDGTYVTPTTFGEAYGILLHKMQQAYPNAQIFAMTLLPENLYSVDKTAWEQHNAYIRAAAEHYDIPVVDLAEKCAITWENYSGYMMDKIHPTTAGMQLISDCIEAELVAYYKENPPHTHTFESAVTAPTCTEQGYITHTCTLCGDSYVDSYVSATGEHAYQDGFCATCDYKIFRFTRDEIVQNLGGVDSTDAAIDTAITNNWYCDIPIPKGAEQVRYLTFKTYGDWGTAFLNGTTYLSGNCDKTTGFQWVTVDIPENATVFRYCYLYDTIAEAKGLPLFEYLEFIGAEMEGCDHNYDSVITAPTCTEGGYTIYTCTRCGDSYTGSETAARHTYDNGYCAVCGIECFDARPANGRHAFSVEVNIAPALHNGQEYTAGTDYGYIQFPTNYSATGEPTRLIIVCHGASATLSSYQSDEWRDNNYTFWTDLGYAVMDMYACPTELSGSTTELHYGNPAVVACYKAGYDYVMERFNLKQDGIFVIGSSMGGLSSFQLVQSDQFPVLAQVGYCPAIDLYKQAYCHPWSSGSYQRSSIAKYFGFEGEVPKFTDSKFPSQAEMDYFEANHSKILEYSPILNNVIAGDPTIVYDMVTTDYLAVDVPEESALYAQLTASHPCPVMIFHNLDDHVVPYRYSKYFKEMVERSGQEVILYTFETGGHDAWTNGKSITVQGINGEITLKESQYEAYKFFSRLEKHEEHYAWTDPAIAPGCTEAGLTQGSHCSVCGEVLVRQQEVTAFGHTPGESVKENETKTGYDEVVYCGVCGEELSREYVQTYLPGDINGDGKVNNKDASRLFQYLSDWNVTVVEAALDVNGDGKVNNKDATRLFQYLSGWNVEIH